MVDSIDAALNQVLDNLEAEAGNSPETPEAPADEQVADEPEPETVEDVGDEAPDEIVDEDDVEQAETPDDSEHEAERPVFAIEDEDALIRLPDGTEVPVKEATLRHADYTRRTQELAEKRREFEEQQATFAQERQQVEDLYGQVQAWVEEKSADPANWAAEIVAESDNPTRALAQAIQSLADQGRLSPEFIEAFGIDAGDSPVRKQADEAKDADRLARVEAELEARKAAEQAQADRQQRIQSMFDEWDQHKLQAGLSFADATVERDVKRETLTLALERGIPVDAAHALIVARKARSTSATAPESSPEVKAPARVPDDKKRATRAMQVRAGSGSTRAPTPPPATVEEAAENALDRFLAGAG